MTTKRYRIRGARTADVDLLVDLENRCFQGPYAGHRFDQRNFLYYLRNPKAIVLVASREGRIVGYALGIVRESRPARTARLLSLAVTPSARRQGLGRRLVRRFDRSVHGRGAIRVSLETLPENRSALRLVESLGYRPRRRLPDYYGPGKAALRLTRDLPDP